jgi:hypothetical protein
MTICTKAWPGGPRLAEQRPDQVICVRHDQKFTVDLNGK